MTKEKWEEIRNKSIQEIPIQIWYDYYKENVDKPYSIQQFTEAFQISLNEGLYHIHGLKGGIREVSHESTLRRFRDYYNQKFAV